MPPLLFPLVRRQTITSARQVGNPRLLRGQLPLPARYLRVFGVTRDSTGVALAACTVHLFRTRDDFEVDESTSDGSGYYEFRGGSPSEMYYVVAYKAGAPDVAGTTANSLIGS